MKKLYALDIGVGLCLLGSGCAASATPQAPVTVTVTATPSASVEEGLMQRMCEENASDDIQTRVDTAESAARTAKQTYGERAVLEAVDSRCKSQKDWLESVMKR